MYNLDQIQSDALHIADVIRKHADRLDPTTVKLLVTLTSNIRTFAERTKEQILEAAYQIVGKPE